MIFRNLGNHARCAGLIALLTGGAIGAPDPVSFTDSTSTLLPGDVGSPFFSGAAMGVVDVDGDSKDDVVRFHRGKDFRVEFQAAPGAAFTSYAGHQFQNIRVAVAAADYDRNGHRDLICGDYESGAHLFTANASGSDFDLTTIPTPPIVFQGINFTDLDNDGAVDIFACDDLDDNHTYRNDNAGGFVFDSSLIDTFIPAQPGQTLPNAGNYASLWTDYDNDGDLDMYLSKCRQGENRAGQRSRINRLFRKNSDGSYSDVAAATGLASGAQSWCADFADVDNDGDLDVFVLNHEVAPTDAASSFYLNNGDGTFTDATASSGLGTPFFGIQAIFCDFNNDAFVDLLVSSTGGGYAFFLNDGDGTFTDQAAVFTTTQTGSGTPLGHIHSYGIGDLDSNGWLDIYAGRATHLNTPSISLSDRLFLNDGGTNHFLQVKLSGATSNPDGIGARVELHGAWGVQLREVRSGEGYGVMHSLTQSFGLGATTTIDRLVVRWPSGALDCIENPTADQLLNVAEGSSPATFEDWRSLVFTPAELLDPAVSDAGANPDCDELGNIFEWYFRTHPKMASSTRRDIASVALQQLAPGDRRLVMTIDRQKIPRLTETAEVTTDLVNWQRGAPHVEVLSDTAGQLVIRCNTNSTSVCFQAMRLVIED